MTEKNGESLARLSFEPSSHPAPARHRKGLIIRLDGSRYTRDFVVMLAPSYPGGPESAGRKSTARSADPLAGGSKPKIRLEIRNCQKMFLGIVAAVELLEMHSDVEWRQIYVDEVKLWNAKSREAFVKRCVEILDDDVPPDFEGKSDLWLRDKNQTL